jgi:hypothetical protein
LPWGLRAFTTKATYYDSQSGLHVPIHDEQNISIFYNARKEGNIPDSLMALKEYPTVVHGLILPKDQKDGIKELLESSPDVFEIFSSSKPSEKEANSVCLMVEFDPSNPEEKKKELQSLFQDGWKTMLTLGDDCFN